MTSDNDAARQQVMGAEEQQDDQARVSEVTASAAYTTGVVADTVGTSAADTNESSSVDAATDGVHPTTRHSVNKVQQLVDAMHRDQGEIDVLKRNTRRILKKLATE